MSCVKCKICLHKKRIKHAQKSYSCDLSWSWKKTHKYVLCTLQLRNISGLNLQAPSKRMSYGVIFLELKNLVNTFFAGATLFTHGQQRHIGPDLIFLAKLNSFFRHFIRNISRLIWISNLKNENETHWRKKSERHICKLPSCVFCACDRRTLFHVYTGWMRMWVGADISSFAFSEFWYFRIRFEKTQN